MKTNKERLSKKLLTTAVILAMAATILGAYITLPTEQGGMGTLTVSAMEDLGSGDSGIGEVYIVEHNSPADLTVNISGDAAILATGDTSGFSVDIPHSTAFDIIVWVRANTTHAYNDSSSAWEPDSLLRCNMTSTDLGISTLTGGTAWNIGNNSTYCWVNYEWNGGGSGYTINRDETASIGTIKLEYYG